MADPQEVIAHPLSLYLAPVGTSFPDLTTDPEGAGWSLIGASGTKNYTEDGVTVSLAQSVEEWTPAGSTMPRKAFRTSEQVTVSVTVADARAEVFQLALNDNDIDVQSEATPAASEGDTSVSLLRGADVTEYALLARGFSPTDNNFVGQFQVPRCYQSAEPELSYVKGEPVAVELTFAALEPDTDAEEDMVVVYATQDNAA